MVKGKCMSKIEDKDLGIHYSRGVEVTHENYPRYKDGLNRSEQNTVKRCQSIGYDKFQTAHYMKVTARAVDMWWAKRKRRTPEEMAADG